MYGAFDGPTRTSAIIEANYYPAFDRSERFCIPFLVSALA